MGKPELLTPHIEPDDYVSLLEKQARELQALRDWRERVRRSFAVVDESVLNVMRTDLVSVDQKALSRLGLLIEHGEA